MPHVHAHGYIMVTLASPSQARGQQAAAAIRALQLQPGVTVDIVSQMEDDPAGRAPNSPPAPGDQFIILVSTNDPPGHWVAHQKIAALGTTVAGLTDNTNTRYFQGLANHWCCYSDY